MNDSSANHEDPTGDYAAFWKEHENNIKVLIRRTDRYIVYIDSEDELDWCTTSKYDADNLSNKAFNAKRDAEIDIAIGLGSAVPIKELSEKIIHGYLTLLGHAMVCRFEHQYESAFAVLGRASTYIGERRSEKSREWYLSYAMKAATFPITFGILLVLLREQAAALLTMDGFDVALATCAGSIGALFSIIWRTGNIDFDRFAAKKLHRIEAHSRIAAGCISGLLAGLAIRSQLLFGSWASGPHPILTMLTVAVAAGTGERLASSIIDHVHAGVSAKKSKPSSQEQDRPGKDDTSSSHNHSTTQGPQIS